MDFHTELRQRMIYVMQSSLRSVRQVLGLGVQEFGDTIGLTRQSINNLENGKSRMNTAQFVAVCAVLDYFTELQPDLMPVVKSILNANDISQENAVFSNVEGNSFLKKWFLCFPSNSKVITMADTNMIRELSENYKIFLDNTALCEMKEENQTESLMEYMEQSGNRFIIPVLAADEIHNRFTTEHDEYSRHGIEMLTKLQKRQLVEFRGEKNDIRLTATLKSVFIKFKMIHRLALITQNRKLAEAILSLNDDSEIGGFEISVFRWHKYGILCDWKNYREEQEEQEEYDEISEEPELSENEDCIQDNFPLYKDEEDYDFGEEDEYPEYNQNEIASEIPSGWDLI